MATQYTAGLSAGQILTAATMNSIGAAWENWTPALTSSGVAPNIGSTGSATGRWGRINKVVFGYGQIIFNGVGIAAGTGFYYVSIPTPALNAGIIVGATQAIDVSTFASYAGINNLDTTTRIQAVNSGGGGLAGALQAGTFVWAAGDFIRFNFMYEAA